MAEALTTLFSDVGGVLVENPWITVADRLSATYPLDRALVLRELELLSKDLDRGKTDLRSFNERLSLSVGQKIPQKSFETLLLESSVKRIVPVWNSLSRIKGEGMLKVIALSNMSRQFWSSLERKFHASTLFDATILSYEHGVIKPEPEIYALALKETQSPPQECIFLDDTPGNLRAAEKLGLKTHLFTSPEETSVFLRSLE